MCVHWHGKRRQILVRDVNKRPAIDVVEEEVVAVLVQVKRLKELTHLVDVPGRQVLLREEGDGLWLGDACRVGHGCREVGGWSTSDSLFCLSLSLSLFCLSLSEMSSLLGEKIRKGTGGYANFRAESAKMNRFGGIFIFNKTIFIFNKINKKLE